ncbi:MAG: polyprenol monophosphomannose synthase [Candidatus Micrarchaeota archaeon]
MLSVIIPTYNEKGNIAILIRRLDASLGGSHEIIVVDDNSPDGTAAEVEAIAAGLESVRLVRRESKAGLTGAILAGVKAAKGDRIAVMDADLSHPPEKVAELSKSLDSADLAVGSRLMEGGEVKKWPLHRKLISRVADALARIVVGTDCTDPLSGFFAARKEVFGRTDFRTKGYKLLLNILADNRGLRVREIPYTFRDRHAGATKLGNIEILTYLLDLCRIRFGRRRKGR